MGEVVAYLRKTGVLTPEEEAGLTGVFAFLSPGAHRPIGLTDREMTRLGRALSAGMCYFLAKRWLGEH